MLPVLYFSRLITGLLLVVIVVARINGSSIPTLTQSRTQTGPPQSREIETEVSHWSAQLKSSDQEKRREAVMMLSRIEGDAALSALSSALTDASPSVRALALAALGERSDTKVVPRVAARLTSDKDPFVRKAAAYALGRFSGPERTSALIAALKDKDQEVRGAAAVSLGDHQDSTAIASLATALSDKNDFVRAQAARALGVNRSAAMPTVPALIRLLTSDPDGEVKRQAASALGLIGDRTALPALERAARDGDSYLSQAAGDAIRMIQAK